MADDPVNKAGRPIWFVASGDGGGTYRPVSRAGWVTMILAVVWVLACGLTGMAAFALTQDGRCFAAMFVAVAIGLAMFAAQVIRHS